MDLSPALSDKLARLLPRLASDAPGEVVATVAAIRRTLDRAGLDLHDLAARLTDAPRPVQPRPHYGAKSDGSGPFSRAEAAPFEMASWLRLHALHRLTENQRDFVVKACGLLATGRALTPKQSEWLRALHAMHKGR
jgi:hypothetical protein